MPGDILRVMVRALTFIRQRTLESVGLLKERIAALQAPGQLPSLADWLADPLAFIPLLPSPKEFLQVCKTWKTISVFRLHSEFSLLLLLLSSFPLDNRNVTPPPPPLELPVLEQQCLLNRQFLDCLRVDLLCIAPIIQ